MAAAACVGGLLLGAVGCTAAPMSAKPSPTPTVVPIFASDEEALAAATEAYANYVATADMIITEGGADPQRIEPYVSGEMAKSEIESFNSLAMDGLHGTGTSTFSNLSVQTMSLDSESGQGIVTAYVCSDVSGTDIVDAAGQSTLSAERESRTPFLLVFDLSTPDSDELVVSSAKVWAGEGVCT